METRPFIRGYTSENSIYVDGVRGGTSQNREMFAIEQVEVTKGSASTTWRWRCVMVVALT